MYVLINQCGNDFSVEAVSSSKKRLQKLLVSKAKKYVKDYYVGFMSDEVARTKGRRLLDELKGKKLNIDYWDNEDDSYLMAWKIEKTVNLKGPGKSHSVTMAFDTETVRDLENAETRKERLAILKEYKDTDMLVKRQFKTMAEKLAYLQGVKDNYGWEMYIKMYMNLTE